MLRAVIIDLGDKQIMKSTKTVLNMVRIIVAVLLLMLISVSTPVQADADTEEPYGSIYMTIEKANIGQGYLMEPCRLDFYQGESLADLMIRLKDSGILDLVGTFSQYGFYMSAIVDESGSLTAAFPEHVTKMAEEAEEPLETERESSSLGEFDYSSYSGWVFSADNEHSPVGATYVELDEGMVIRWAFSVMGYGADCWDTGYGESPLPATDRGELVMETADFAASPDFNAKMSLPGVKEAYENVLKAGCDYGASQDEIDAAVQRLKNALDNWGIPTYEWADDYSSVTAKCVNTTDSSTVEETAFTLLYQSKAPTCDERGETTYTADFNSSLFEHQEKTIENIDALGHSWDAGTVTKEPSCTKPGVRTYTCTRDSSHTREEEIDIVDHEWIVDDTTDANGWKVTKPATETEEGEKARACKHCDRVEKEVIPKITPTPEPTPDPKPTPNPDPKPAPAPSPTPAPGNDKEVDPTPTPAPASEPDKDVDKITPSEAALTEAKVDKKLAIDVSKIVTGAKAKKKQMTVKWKKVKGATNYKISYRQAGKKWTQAWAKGKNTYVLKNMKKYGLYEFKIMAVKKSGSTWIKSSWSEVNYRFFANTSQKMTGKKKAVLAKVKKVKKASGYDLQYSLKKSALKTGKINSFKGAAKTRLKVKGLKAKKNYFVRVRPYKNHKGHKYIGIWNGAKKAKTK